MYAEWLARPGLNPSTAVTIRHLWLHAGPERAALKMVNKKSRNGNKRMYSSPGSAGLH